VTAVVVKAARVGLQSEIDIVAARRAVTQWASDMGLSILDRTKAVTAASELARNTIIYGRGGTMSMEMVRDGIRSGLRLTFEDQGPGIADIDRALQDGFSTGGGMGLGLPGAKRLMNEFSLRSGTGTGTTVTVVRWKP
jgi:serine/threonine-protein kinase RsbT